jgi:hypothetical protein
MEHRSSLSVPLAFCRVPVAYLDSPHRQRSKPLSAKKVCSHQPHHLRVDIAMAIQASKHPIILHTWPDRSHLILIVCCTTTLVNADRSLFATPLKSHPTTTDPSMCTPYSVRSTVQSISSFHAHAHGRIHGFWSGYSALRTVEWFFVGLVPI